MRRVYGFAVLAMILLSFVLMLRAGIPIVQTGTWASAGQMSVARAGAAAVQLPDGRVMIIGGTDASGAPTASAEFFNPDGTWSAAPPMSMPRAGHAAVWLADGEVLVTGGITMPGGGPSNAAEIFDPLTGHWTTLGSTMLAARSGHTMTQLLDGNVLIAGGRGMSGSAVSTLEILQLGSRQFTSAGTLQTGRFGHGADVLQDGRVLIAGGSTVNADGSIATLASTEIFDPANGVSAGPQLIPARTGASVTTLLDGTVLIAGGSYPEGAAQGAPPELANLDIFNPADGSLKPAAQLKQARAGHQAFLLPHNANVLIVGGTFNGSAVASVEQFTPWTGNIQSSTMSAARAGATGSPLNVLDFSKPNDGLILIAGGKDANGTAQGSAELYRFATVTSDKNDYQVGQVVYITGTGWQPNETVTLSFREKPSIDTPGPFIVTADANGSIADSEFVPDTNDIDVRFFLTAVGSSSGLQTQYTFTDSNPIPTVTTIVCNPSTFPPAGGIASCTATVAIDPNATPNANLAGTITWTIDSGNGYFGPTPAPTTWSCDLTGPDGGKSITCPATYTFTGSNPQTLTATFAPSNNGKHYSASSATLSLNLVPMTITADNQTVTYGGTMPTLTYTANPNVALDTNPSCSSATSSTADVGTYVGAITCSGAAKSGYSISYAAGSLTITQATPSVIATGGTFNYDGTPHAGSGTATGVLTPSDNLTPVTLSYQGSGSTTYGPTSTAPTNVGTYTVTASFAGSTNYKAASSTAVPLTISAIAPAFTNLSAPTIHYGDTPTTLGGTLKNGSLIPTGNVSITLNGVTQTAAINPSTGNFSFDFATGALTVAGSTYTITYSYAGDTNFSSVSDTSKVLTVNPALTTTTPVGNPQTSVYGEPVTITVTVAAVNTSLSSPTSGTVALAIYPGSDTTVTPIRSTTLTLSGSNVVTYGPASDLPVGGPRTVVATYSPLPGPPPSNYAGSTGTFIHMVNKADTTTAVTSSLTPTVFGQSVTFTATVSVVGPGAGTPTGTVTFKDGSTTLGAGTVNGSGVATFTTSSLSVATHSITAAYGGDGNFNTSTSSAIDQVVNKASTTASVATSGTPSEYGQSVTFTATVSVTAPGAGTPTGTVTFYDSGTSIGTGSVSGGQATLTTSTLAVGDHPITVSYGGDSNFLASGTSPSITQKVNQATTTTTITNDLSTATVANQSYDVYVHVAPHYTGTPTGTVTVSDGSASCTTAAIDASGNGSCTLTSTTVGAKTITATYGGDTNFLGSAGTKSHQVNPRATSTAVTFSNNPLVVYDTTNVTVTVTDIETAGTKSVPAGTIALTNSGGESFTGTCTLAASSSTTASCTVSLTPTAPGNHTIQASFTATDSVHNISSDSETLTVNRRDTTTGLTLSTAVVVGQASSLTVTVTDSSTGGTKQLPTGTISLSSTEATDTFGTCTLTSGGTGVATCTTTVTPHHVGTSPHTITANFVQTAVHNASSNTGSLAVNPAATTTALTSSLNPSQWAQPVTFTATVTVNSPGAGSPTGTVTFYDGGTPLGAAVALSGGGTATFSTFSLSVATHSITAVYSGDFDFLTSTGSLSQEVDKATPNVAVNSSPNPSIYGNSVTFTATVTSPRPLPSSMAAPSGAVNFYDGACVTGTLLNTTPIALSGGVATFSTAALDVIHSPHTVTACYLGDTNYNTNSGATSQTVTPKALTVTGLTVNQKIYDATTTATLNFGGASLVGVISPDVVSIATTGYTATFQNAYVGTWPVTVTGLGLTGAQALNYTLTQPTGLTGTIVAADTRTTGVLLLSPTVTFGGGNIKFGSSVVATNSTAIVNEGVVTFTVKQDSTPMGSTTANVSNGTATGTFNVNSLNVGSYTVYASYSDAASPHVNFNPSDSATTGTFKVVPYQVTGSTLTVTGTPTPTLSLQYSDNATLTLTVPNTGFNGQVPIVAGTTATFSIGTQQVASGVGFTCNGGSCVATTTVPLLENPNGNGQMAPGAQNATAVLVGSNPNFQLASTPTGAFTIDQEDALVTYTGLEYFSTVPTQNVVNVPVSFTLQDATAAGSGYSDIYDALPGDITKTKTVAITLSGTYFDTSGTQKNYSDTTSCQTVAIAAVPGQVGSNGLPSTATTGSCTFPQVPVNGSYTVAISPGSGSYYQFAAEGDTDVPIVTGNDGSGFITGGGYQKSSYLTNLTGAKPTGALSNITAKLNFGYTAKYNKSGKNLQASVNIIVRAACSDTEHAINALKVSYAPASEVGTCLYQIKSNKVISMTDNPYLSSCSLTSGGCSPGYGVLVVGANVQDVTNSVSIPITGNLTLQLVMYDNGEPGSGAAGDTLTIDLRDNAGNLWLSNSWSGTKTAIWNGPATGTPGLYKPMIQGGNIQVH